MRITVFIIVFLIMTGGVMALDNQTDSLPPGDNPPPTALDRIKNAGDVDDFDSAAYVIVFDSSLNRVNNLGITYVDGCLLYKVLTEEGCKKLSVIAQGYEPLSSYVEIREVNIIRGDESIPVAVEDALDLPAPQSMIYWGDRIKVLQLPRLCIGDGIEVRTFRKGYSYALLDSAAIPPDNERYIPPMPGQYFDIVLFEATTPMVKKKYVLQLPSNKRLHSQIYNGPMYSSTTYNADTTTYAWWAEDIPAWGPQRYRPDASDIVAKVVMATVESWEAKSRWFFEVNEPQFEVTDAVKAKVDEILADAGVAGGTEAEKAFELVHWVAQNIRYSGQTMGEGEGFTLHSGAMIFEQRSGVCKDIAGMLVTMMRAAEMDSYAAMTMAGSRIDEVPADQFNHCVVALKKEDGSFVMYDPTWVPYNKDIWSKYETEQHYLIGTPEGEGLSRIRYSPPNESPLHLTSAAIILDDGTLEGTFEFDGDGAMDSRLRGMINWYSLAELENNLSNMLHHISDRVELIGYEHGDILDFKKSMWWKIDYRIPEYGFPVDGGFEFESPMMKFITNSGVLFRAATYDWPEKRRDDVFFYTTQLIDADEIVKLPKGYRVSDPKKSEEIDETYAYFKGESDMTGKGLAIKQKVKIKRRQIPPDGYDGFRKAIDEAKEYAKTVFRAEKGDAE
jgi:hypothetical protein